MAWTSPMTAVANTAFDASEFNTHVRDNLLATAPAKALRTDSVFTVVKPNMIEERAVGTLTMTSTPTLELGDLSINPYCVTGFLLGEVVPNSTETVVTSWTSSLRDDTVNDNLMFDQDDDPGVIRALKPGLYDVGVTILWDNNISGDERSVYIAVNDTSISGSDFTVMAHALPNTSYGTSQMLHSVIPLNTNDEVRIIVFQDSGGSLSLEAPLTSLSYFWIGRIPDHAE